MYKWTTQHVEEAYIHPDAEDCDIIGGIVTNIYDGNTFSISVTEEDYDNEFEYQDHEIIRIFGDPAPGIGTPAGKEAAEELFEELEGEQVILQVYGRDKHGYLIALYEVV